MRALVVGHGVMGKNHARVLRSMGHQVDTLDPSPSSGAGHRMLTRELIDAADVVCVATPIDELSRLAADWLERGKDVLVEKPGALSVADLRRLRRHALKFARTLRVGYTERFNPVVHALSDQLHRVGCIRHIHIRRLGYAADRAGDPVLDLATHDLDVLDSLDFGFELESVMRNEHHVAALLKAQHTSQFLLNTNCSVSLEASHLHPAKVRELEVVGDDGVLQLDYQAQTLGFIGPDRLRVALPVDQAEPLQREWEAFFNGEGSTGIAALKSAEQMTEAETPVRMAA